MQKVEVLVATDNSTEVAYINKQKGTHSAEMCALLWKIMTWYHHYQITLIYYPGRTTTKSNQQNGHCICQKWFTPHVDLYATRLNHKVPLYVSPVPDQHSWDIDALNINCIRQSSYLIILIAPGWPKRP